MVNPPKYRHASICKSVAICAPAIRTVVLQGSLEDDGIFFEIYPVVAIQCSLIEQWSMPWTERSPGLSTDPSTMKGLGWRMTDSPSDELMPIVVDKEYGVAQESLIRASNAIEITIACTWDQSRDDEFIQPYKDQITARLKERTSRSAVSSL